MIRYANHSAKGRNPLFEFLAMSTDGKGTASDAELPQICHSDRSRMIRSANHSVEWKNLLFSNCGNECLLELDSPIHSLPPLGKLICVLALPLVRGALVPSVNR
jgi:hypothetical protein